MMKKTSLALGLIGVLTAASAGCTGHFMTAQEIDEYNQQYTQEHPIRVYPGDILGLAGRLAPYSQNLTPGEAGFLIGAGNLGETVANRQHEADMVDRATGRDRQGQECNQSRIEYMQIVNLDTGESEELPGKIGTMAIAKHLWAKRENFPVNGYILNRVVNGRVYSTERAIGNVAEYRNGKKDFMLKIKKEAPD